MGDDTTLSFTYQTDGFPRFTVEVYSPSGRVHHSNDANITTIDEEAKIMKMKMPGTASVSVDIQTFINGYNVIT